MKYEGHSGGRLRARPSQQAIYVNAVHGEVIQGDDGPMDEPLSFHVVHLAIVGPRAVVEGSMMTGGRRCKVHRSWETACGPA